MPLARFVRVIAAFAVGRPHESNTNHGRRDAMRMNQRFAVYGMAAALCFSVGTLAAQDTTKTDSGNTGRRNRGNFDPAQFQQRMMDNIKTRLAFTNDTEWAAVQPLVQKVMDARRDSMTQGGGFGRMGGRGAGNGGDNAAQGADARPNAPKPLPEAEALQKLVDDKVPAAEIKTALEKYRAARKDRDAKLTAAQDALRKVLTVRQEAEAALLGLVP